MKRQQCISETFKKLKIQIKETHVFEKQKWNNISATLIFQILYCKFNSNEELKEKLLQTGDKIIIYQNLSNNPTIYPQNWYQDFFWGANAIGGFGYNVLGNLLCLVREYLKNGKTPPLYHDT